MAELRLDEVHGEPARVVLQASAEGCGSPTVSHTADELASMDQSLTITASHVVANVIKLGYPDESGEARESRPRLSKDEIVRWERW